MLRASALAIVLLTTPILAAPPSPFWFEQMAEEDGTPDIGGGEWNLAPGYYITHPMPGDDVYGDDEWENGRREPWSCETADMERPCHPVYDNPDYEGDYSDPDFVAWNTN